MYLNNSSIMDQPVIMDHIKAENCSQPQADWEADIHQFAIQKDSVPKSVEIVDLTNDEYLSEYEAFLKNIKAHRKPNPNKRSLKNVVEIVPLQVAHLQLINLHQDAYVGTVFGMDFKNVMVYGRITPGPVRHENNTHIYNLDDGTGVVSVHYSHGLPRDIDNLTAVHRCEDILTNPTPLNEEQVPADQNRRTDLKLLLELVKTRCRQRLEYFRLGDRCFAIGRPFLDRFDRVAIYAYSLHSDNDSAGHSAEIFWKTHLALCYEQKYGPAVTG
ncbi:uncharacterized protein LOC129765294 [Toxorhynchites rutilus septentrionalis]|uniref:uncharacterized protein LOC129765294 n=1 Tax=Toxorhynchites rutilus septentrionalis TaxID=329112 RepID=UPI002478EBCF|nr:uncharacterized protein LOC129765294 [Toxorhynchites rutilus septentrionalis]